MIFSQEMMVEERHYFEGLHILSGVTWTIEAISLSSMRVSNKE
jgi:hypothetical protein